MGDGELCRVLVIRNAAQDRTGAQKWNAAAFQQQGRQHLAVLEAATVQKRNDEIGGWPFHHGVIIVGGLQIDAQAPQGFAKLVMIERMIAVGGMGHAAAAGMFGQKQDFQPTGKPVIQGCEAVHDRNGHPGTNNHRM